MGGIFRVIESWESGSLLSFATIAGVVEDAGDESPTTDVTVERTGGGVGGTGGGIRETCGGLAGRSLVYIIYILILRFRKMVSQTCHKKKLCQMLTIVSARWFVVQNDPA